MKALAKAHRDPDILRPSIQKSQSSSVVEQRFRKPQVKGSIPFSGSSFFPLKTAWIQGSKAKSEEKSFKREFSHFDAKRLVKCQQNANG